MPASADYQTILVGTDFSPASRNAVRHATALARRLGAQLHVVHVLEKLKPAQPFSKANRQRVDLLRKELKKDAHERMEKLLRNALKGEEPNDSQMKMCEMPEGSTLIAVRR